MKRCYFYPLLSIIKLSMAEKKQEIDPELLKALEEATEEFGKPPPSVEKDVSEALGAMQAGGPAPPASTPATDAMPPGFPFMPPNPDDPAFKAFQDLFSS